MTEEGDQRTGLNHETQSAEKRQKLEEAPSTPPPTFLEPAVTTISPTVVEAPTPSLSSQIGVLVLYPVPFVMWPPQEDAESGKELYVRKLTDQQVASLRASLPEGEDLERGAHVKVDEKTGTFALTHEELKFEKARHVKSSDIAAHIRGDGQVMEKRLLVFKVKRVNESSKRDSPWRSISGYVVDKNGSKMDTEFPMSVKFLKGLPADVNTIEEDDELVFFAFKVTKERGKNDGNSYLSIICPVDAPPQFGKVNVFFYLKKNGQNVDLLQDGFFV